MEVKNVAIGLLKPYAKNAKKHPDEQVDKIARSIKEFGFKQPIVVDKKNVVIIGHGRLLAFRIPLNSTLLAFIGFQLLDISMNLSYFRVKDKRRAKAMRDMFNGFMEGIGKESKHGRRDEKPRGRSEDGDDTER